MGIVNACKGCGAMELHVGLNQAGKGDATEQEMKLIHAAIACHQPTSLPPNKPTSLGRQRENEQNLLPQPHTSMMLHRYIPCPSLYTKY